MSSGLPSSPTWSEIFQRILCTVRAWRTWRRGDIAMSCEGCGSLLLASERTKCDDCVWAERMTAAPASDSVLAQHAALYAAMQNAPYQWSADQMNALLNTPIGTPIRVSSGMSGQLFGGMVGNIGDLSGMLSGRPRS